MGIHRPVVEAGWRRAKGVSWLFGWGRVAGEKRGDPFKDFSRARSEKAVLARAKAAPPPRQAGGELLRVRLGQGRFGKRVGLLGRAI